MFGDIYIRLISTIDTTPSHLDSVLKENFTRNTPPVRAFCHISLCTIVSSRDQKPGTRPTSGFALMPVDEQRPKKLLRASRACTSYITFTPLFLLHHSSKIRTVLVDTLVLLF
jgi:hypothetical protein